MMPSKGTLKTLLAGRAALASGILLTVSALVCAALALPAHGGTDEGFGQASAEKKKVFTEEDLKVEKLDGKWSVQCAPDPKQADDFSVPVYVKGTNMFWGTGKYLGRAKVPEVMLENRGPRPTQAMQLRWAVVGVDDPETILLEGVTPSFEAEVEPFTSALVDTPEIYFNKILKPLRKEDGLNGQFRLLVGVQEVRFSDGTTWQQTQRLAFSKTSYLHGGPEARAR